MYGLSFFVSYVVLAGYFQDAITVPTKPTLLGDQFTSSTDLTSGISTVEEDSGINRRECPCLRNESVTRDPGRLDWPSREHQLFEQAQTSTHVLIHGMICACNLDRRNTPSRDDYRYTPGIGAHKLHTRAAVWNVARKLCIEEGGHLAIINSNAEAHILMDIFNRSGPVKGASYPDEAFLGIHDLYSEGDWVTVLGDSLAKTGYTGWSDKWGGQPDNGGGRQNCGAFMKEGGLDDVACDVPFPFFCELPTMRVL